jgi:hypothetical protein
MKIITYASIFCSKLYSNLMSIQSLCFQISLDERAGLHLLSCCYLLFSFFIMIFFVRLFPLLRNLAIFILLYSGYDGFGDCLFQSSYDDYDLTHYIFSSFISISSLRMIISFDEYFLEWPYINCFGSLFPDPLLSFNLF